MSALDDKLFICHKTPGYTNAEWSKILSHVVQKLEVFLGQPVAVHQVDYHPTGLAGDISSPQVVRDLLQISWFGRIGMVHYPHSTSMLLLCDGGGSNASNRYVFKHALENLANRIGREIRIAHYPPYKSKFNPVEHRLFPHVTRACKGVIFLTVEIALEKMAKTTTSTGLTTTVHLLPGEYPIGVQAPEGYKETMKIVFDDELPPWNYRAIPTKKGS